MTDDLSDLKAALKAATPVADEDARAMNIARAQKNFETRQGSAQAARPNSDRPRTGLWSKGKSMFDVFSTRGALAASTALVAGAFVVLGPLSDDLFLTTPGVSQQVPGDEILASDDVRKAVAEAEMSGAELGLVRDLATTQVRPGAPKRAVRIQQAEASLAPSPELGMVRENVVRQKTSEAFATAPASSLKITAEDPVSTFSIDVDTASYAVVRNSLLSGHLPAREAVRVEEMVNYFPYDYLAPDTGAPFQPTVSVTDTPWNADTQLVHIAIQGAENLDRPPLNLVFLVDTSGSMNAANKLPLLKQSFALMLGQLQPEDQVAIVAYAGSAGQVLAPTKAEDRDTILAALDRLHAGGSTAGQAGLQQAYALADQMQEDGEVSRVILATDGDFNVGLSDPGALKTFIAEKRGTGTYLSVLGFGRGNLDDATMQALAQNGNGQAAYIDTLGEAQKVLVDQLSGALYPIADDVKIQVEFNPAQIAEYRLIGYETRSLRREDFNNDRVDAGDIGAGHRVTALYEVTPVGSPARLSDPLRYGAEVSRQTSDELGFLRLRYKLPGAQDSALTEQMITPGTQPATDADFAIAMAGFGQLLRGDTALGEWGWDEAINLAVASRGDDPFGYRAEAVQLMRLAQSLSAR